MTSMKVLLETIIFGGGSAAFVYWLLSTPAVVTQLEKLRVPLKIHLGLELSVLKRTIAIVLSAAISTGAFVVYTQLGYALLPASFEGWANLVIQLGGLAFTGSQVLHMRELQTQ